MGSDCVTRTASGEAGPSSPGYVRRRRREAPPGGPATGRTSPATAAHSQPLPTSAYGDPGAGARANDNPSCNASPLPGGDPARGGRASTPAEEDARNTHGAHGTRRLTHSPDRPALYDRLGCGGRDDHLCYSLAQKSHRVGEWLRAFRLAGNGSTNPYMTGIRQLRVLIWRQTQYLTGFYGGQHLGALVLAPASDTRTVRLVERQPADGRASVTVRSKDFLEMARELHGQGMRVAVLNMANARRAGGGVESGAGAQEENLYRRSDTWRSLAAQHQHHYPIPRDACLLSKDVTIFRGPESIGYPMARTRRPTPRSPSGVRPHRPSRIPPGHSGGRPTRAPGHTSPGAQQRPGRALHHGRTARPHPITPAHPTGPTQFRGAASYSA